jgi:Na+/H+-dicarboxylate symporter
MPLPRDDRFWPKVIRIAGVVGIALSAATLVVVYVTFQHFAAGMRERPGGQFIVAALVPEQLTLTLLAFLTAVLSFGVFHAAGRSRNGA